MPSLDDAIFIHIPKTGGSSIRAALWPGTRNQHCLAKDVPDERWERGFSFAFVRCPYQRLASSFRYHCGDRYDGILRDDLPERTELSFADYLTLARDPPGFWAPSFYSQALYVDRGRRRKPIDFIGRYETFAADVARLFAALGVTAALPRVNANPAPDYDAILGPDERAMIRELYAEDFERFGYPA